MGREYEFIVTTEGPHHPEGPARGLIRRLVMRNFFETKWSGPEKNTPELNSASTVHAKPNLKSRFRLPKQGQEMREPKAKAKCKSVEWEASGGVEEKKESSTVSARKSIDRHSDMSESNWSRPSSRTASSGGKGGQASIRMLLKTNPSAHRFDPFDVLPVPGTPQLDMLFKLYKCGSRTNAMAINARNTWWSFISNDAGLLHATLATWALYGMLARGMSELRVEKLRHKNEAIKEIKSKVGGASGEISDQLVGTVLTLASFENLVGAYEAAQLHIAALKRMVNARGGLPAFGHNDGLVRGIIWVDFHTAAAFHTPPSFPRISLGPTTRPLPDALLEEAACTSPTSLLQLSLAAVDCFNIFYRIHRLALAVSTPWFRKVDRLTISNLLYETEYIILSIPDYSRDFLDFDMGAKHDADDEGDCIDRANMADSASVVEAILAATHIFVYAALREIPPKAKIFSILLERLQVALDRPAVNILDVWRKEKNLNILLWALVIASSVAATWGGRNWWIGRLSEVVKELDMHSERELEESVKRVAWTDVFFGEVLGSIWDEVREYRRVVQMVEMHLTGSREDSIEETVDARLLSRGGELEARLGCPVEYEKGRWKVNGWYV
ncbi:hypothetical protein K505DRAFT_365673 [Melanomma pulvis-pyrius CBS 109.77]|uniref:Transcription factor domain-containing protein n=1 Tax=Melanomma pulvis-pyrius CBS 109.77 TaxID=1314802 RepID=A0A6A6WZH8_9PLEO|nr:hypothetical protein K505DRAFT_365673 [Melanomma pulvis-pyrius CBS 109.77]